MRRERGVEEQDFSAVLDLIHAAALRPQGWDDVLRRLAALTGSVAGGLTIERPLTRQGVPLFYFGFDPGHVARCFDRFLPLNPLFAIQASMQRGFVVANADVVAPAVFRRSEFFNGWARPQGLCSPITVVIHRTPAAYVPLTLVRPDGAGEAGAADRALLTRLAPHLAHAMDVNLRLQAAEAVHHDVGAMLDALPCGALLVDRQHRIVAANAAARKLLDPAAGGMLSGTFNKLAMRDPRADRRFQAMLAAALKPGAQGSHVPVPDRVGEDRLTLTVVPVPPADGANHALDTGDAGQPRCLVLVGAPNIAGLARQYGLTPAESRVAAAIAAGRGLTAAAEELGIARSTARSHLDKIFQKTGTNRQAALVGLVQAGLGF